MGGNHRKHTTIITSTEVCKVCKKKTEVFEGTCLECFTNPKSEFEIKEIKK